MLRNPKLLTLLFAICLPHWCFAQNSEIPPGSPSSSYLRKEPPKNLENLSKPDLGIPHDEEPPRPEPKTFTLEKNHDSLDTILKVGARALAWKSQLLKFDSIRNQSSPVPNPKSVRERESQLLSLDLTHRPENPEVFSPKILNLAYDKLIQNCPGNIKSTLLGSLKFPILSASQNSELISILNQLDRLYALALRYRSLIQEKEHYIRSKRWDFRTLLFLPKNEKRWRNKDRPFSQLTLVEKNELREIGESLCQNATGNTPQECKTLMERQILERENFASLFETWRTGAQKNFETRFQVSSDRERRDLEITNSPSGLLISLPFLEMSDFKYKALLIDAVHTFWRNLNPPTSLVLQFQTGVQSIPIFSWLPWMGRLPRLTLIPHSQTSTLTRGRHNSEIILNSSIDPIDANLKWQVAHEIGHVLGFPDCYVEFYDTALEAFVQYSLEKDNIMCEMGGRAKPIHFQALRRISQANSSQNSN